MTTFHILAIGQVESPVLEPTDLDWGSVISRVVLLPQYRPGLQGLDAFSHVIVVTFLHRAAFDSSHHLVRRPRDLATMPAVGIFSQRAKDRPNPIGIPVVRLRSVQPGGVEVQGLDATDGTPVLDLKPYYPQYDAAESPVVPEWVDQLMRDYF